MEAVSPVSDRVVAGAETCLRNEPLRYTLYPLRPEPPVSVEGFQERSICEQLVAVADSPDGTDGGVVSGHAGVVAEATLLLADSLPALSTAEIWYE